MDTSRAEHLGQAVTAVRPRHMAALPLVFPVLTDPQVRQTTHALMPSQISTWVASSSC